MFLEQPTAFLHYTAPCVCYENLPVHQHRNFPQPACISLFLSTNVTSVPLKSTSQKLTAAILPIRGPRINEIKREAPFKLPTLVLSLPCIFLDISKLLRKYNKQFKFNKIYSTEFTMSEIKYVTKFILYYKY